MGVLQNFREHVKNGDAIKLLDNGGGVTEDIVGAVSVQFGDADTIVLDQPTEFLVDGKPTELRVVVHCYLHRDSSAAEYLADCQNKHLTNVSFLQRNDLLSWLSGRSETSAYLQENDATSTLQTGEKLVPAEGTIGETAQNTKEERGDGKEKEEGTSAVEPSAENKLINADPVLVNTLKNERNFFDHNSSLRGSKPIDFGYLIQDSELKLVQSIKASLRSSKNGATNGHVLKTANTRKPTQRKDPIILIPSATSSLITLSNIKQFLEGSRYIDPRQLPSSLNDNLITVEKKFDRLERPIKFIVVNNTRMFTKPEYWDRVVAVFTTGHSWQFNNYQWNTPQELFQHCKGYYFHFSGEEVPQHVQQWNVQRVELDKSQRFKDVEIVRYFWNSLEKELLARGYQ
ncbi:Cdc73p KNAG_0B06350 [Huiozyma naganishii CBS 8797]|uniref:Cell division control protein 73 C-terminal domain-containing protein n=1 Tax=Huiozyma naganishii (strain ATCC MYA-139 / BCRC 22969 / CBS 8797 / KCTC 17520 / NBRC 10181 / NCYC 3082 / Yp74L-3) TaxID=1071383 RepID=J7RHP2_HUIN7|nr:hypothetical protein KNAG_0B06350 [Kazachstania naganishii CBS 8797]CCK69063.1 hypothetical protein KNAG_0B06350 [Kazachstania naganishii CBS 8797]